MISVATPSAKEYVHTDRLGSTAFGTDSGGNICSHIQYNEWGVPAVVAQGLLEPNYTGLAWDDALEIYYAKPRMYDPINKRFMAVDPIKGVLANPQSMNQYAYVLNNPLKYYDPDGESPTILIGAAAGAIIGGGASLISQAVNGEKINWGKVGGAAASGAIAGALIGTGVGIVAGASVAAGTLATGATVSLGATMATGASISTGIGIGTRTISNAVNTSKSGTEIINNSLDTKHTIPDAVGGALGAGVGYSVSGMLPVATTLPQTIIKGAVLGGSAGMTGANAQSGTSQILTNGRIDPSTLLVDTTVGGASGAVMGGAIAGLTYSQPFKPCAGVQDIKPPGWNENWEWRYGTRGNTPRWFDPNGGEWRLHTPDIHHTTIHWDYNPWIDWNSQWQNLPFGGGQI
jgi:RHS repeat-associated protein